MHEDLRLIHQCVEYITQEIENTILLASDVFYLIEQGVDAHTALDPETITPEECRAREPKSRKLNQSHLDQSGIDLIPISFPLDQSGIDLFSSGSRDRSLSSGSIRDRSHPICFHLEQSGMDFIQSLLILINQESISSNLISSGSIRNRFHAISSHLINMKLISSNLFSSGSIRNRSHPISFHLDQSEIDFMQSLLIWNKLE
ncbi:hypothetical protein CDAR_264811 [Caerostris darwini]|uniref:Uncharacterized protein n=1 Tax=Caerostris darwini TaxID=1538125 RepID=A0AAV4NKQ4_9ARAC|nr:hypothetical protein CDAR_264811 [Caerostris darwini]